MKKKLNETVIANELKGGSLFQSRMAILLGSYLDVSRWVTGTYSVSIANGDSFGELLKAIAPLLYLIL